MRVAIETNGEVIYVDCPHIPCQAQGLAIHKTVGLNIHKKPLTLRPIFGNGYFWNISHIETGKTVIEQIPGRDKARQIAKRLAVLDWTGELTTEHKKLVKQIERELEKK